MKRTLKSIMALLCCALISACATTSPGPGGGFGTGASLDRWMEETAVPYLIKELGEHPMFKNQPFLLIGMKGDDVRAEIDDLTVQLRERIIDGLLTKPGVNLTWKPTRKPWERIKSLGDIQCVEHRPAKFYIGLDVGLTSVNKKLYVKVRALDLGEEKWVSGFILSWSGKPTPPQLAALERKQPDPSLLGRRDFPFNGEQPDLLARHLARDLSCRFAPGERDEMNVYVERKSVENISFFRNAFSLLKNYLAKFKEVTVTDDPAQANITVDARVHPVHGGLHQVWGAARYKDGKKYLPGTETEAYVYLKPDEMRKDERDVDKLEKEPAAGRDVRVCFYNFGDYFDMRIHPLLRQAPGVIRVHRTYRECGTKLVCLCYALKYNAASPYFMEELKSWLYKRLSASGELSFSMTRKTETLLEVQNHGAQE